MKFIKLHEDFWNDFEKDKEPITNYFDNECASKSTLLEIGRNFPKYYDSSYEDMFFMKQKKQKIPLKSLIPTQPSTMKSKLTKLENKDIREDVYMVKYNNKYYLYDGHHRAAYFWLEILKAFLLYLTY